MPTAEPGYAETGIGSWYGPGFHGRATASGETYDQEALTAAHPTLPINSLVQVTNLENGREIIVRVNDRGPFAHQRLIDVSRAARRCLGLSGQGKRACMCAIWARPRGVCRRQASAAPAAVDAAQVDRMRRRFGRRAERRGGLCRAGWRFFEPRER